MFSIDSVIYENEAKLELKHKPFKTLSAKDETICQTKMFYSKTPN
jgi:hypothetical protein